MVSSTILSFLPSLRKQLLSLPKQYKVSVLLLTDATVLIMALYGAFVLSLNSFQRYPLVQSDLGLVALMLITKLIVFSWIGLYRSLLRYAGLELISIAIKGIVLSYLFIFGFLSFIPSTTLSPSLLITDALFSFLMVVSVRILLRSLVRSVYFAPDASQTPEQIIIYGAGTAGTHLAQALLADKHYRPIAFIDDDPNLQNQVIQGLTIYSPNDLAWLRTNKPFDAVLLSMPALEPGATRAIAQWLREQSIVVKTVPRLQELLAGKLPIQDVQALDITELLGREEVPPHGDLMNQTITQKVVLVTGAGGSIGSELCRQIAELSPQMLILYEQSEFALYTIDLELKEKHPHLQAIACLGSVTDQDYFSKVLKQYEVNTVYHAAAYKHVPLVEENPAQGILNNVFGTLTAAMCAVTSRVQNFVLISTDKAVRPTNVMGATKRVAELILQALADLAEVSTCFTIVRFGNVLGSSGSVVPRFYKQIAAGGPVTITHPEMTRYFMTIPEAARLVIQAGAMGRGGEVFLLDMGQPVRIYDLAAQMIRLYGLEPHRDIEIRITGMRPGEKLYEELLIDHTQSTPTRHPKIFSAYESKLSWECLHPYLDMLLNLARMNDNGGILSALQNLVPEYQPNRPQHPIHLLPLSEKAVNV